MFLEESRRRLSLAVLEMLTSTGIAPVRTDAFLEGCAEEPPDCDACIP